MRINLLADRVRASLPRGLWNVFRKIGNIILGPWFFSFETGYFQSACRSKAVDRHGNPLPWFVYPAIQFLLAKDFRQKTVLEWGAGQSTRWWAARSRRVVSFEGDRDWHAMLCQNKPANATIHLVKEDLSDAARLIGTELFDVIIVDGLDRYKCAELSLQLLAPGGAIIVDNAEGNHGPRPGYGILNLYREAGFSRVDFYGYAPGNTIQHCTSLFYRGDCFVTRGEELPKVHLAFSADEGK